MSTFGEVVQSCLALMVCGVLLSEYLWERANAGLDNPARRPDQFWLDSYKICAGAFMSHLFNIFTALVLSSMTHGGDECALYAIAFYYECTGVTFVQLLNYFLAKYARIRYREGKQDRRRMTSPFCWCNPYIEEYTTYSWEWLKSPGKYFKNVDFNTVRLPQTDSTAFLKALIGVPGVANSSEGLISHRENSAREEPREATPDLTSSILAEFSSIRDKPREGSMVQRTMEPSMRSEGMPTISSVWTDASDSLNIKEEVWIHALKVAGVWTFIAFILGLAGGKSLFLVIGLTIFVFLAVMTQQVAPPAANWQVVWWVVIKCTEKMTWGIMVLCQHTLFVTLSDSMRMESATLEAWIYIAIVPMLLNCWMFFMLSRIARLELPFLKLSGKIKNAWDWPQVISIGVTCTFVINFSLYVMGGILVIRRFDEADTLLITMVLIPILLALMVSFAMRYLLFPDDASHSAQNLRMSLLAADDSSDDEYEAETSLRRYSSRTRGASDSWSADDQSDSDKYSGLFSHPLDTLEPATYSDTSTKIEGMGRVLDLSEYVADLDMQEEFGLDRRKGRLKTLGKLRRFLGSCGINTAEVTRIVKSVQDFMDSRQGGVERRMFLSDVAVEVSLGTVRCYAIHVMLTGEKTFGWVLAGGHIKFKLARPSEDAEEAEEILQEWSARQLQNKMHMTAERRSIWFPRLDTNKRYSIVENSMRDRTLSQSYSQKE